MAIEEIHKFDEGTSFQLTVKDTLDGVTSVVDISTASVMEIVFQKSDGVKLTKTATLVTDGTDGVMQYATTATDLDVTGGWKIQGIVTLPTGKWSTDISKFKVYDNLI